MEECICRGLNFECIRCGGGGFINKSEANYSQEDLQELRTISILEKFPMIISKLNPDFYKNLFGDASINEILNLKADAKIGLYYRIIRIKTDLTLLSALRVKICTLEDSKEKELFLGRLNNIELYHESNTGRVQALRELAIVQFPTLFRTKRQTAQLKTQMVEARNPYESFKYISKKTKTANREKGKKELAFLEKWEAIFLDIAFARKYLRHNLKLDNFIKAFYAYLTKSKWRAITFSPDNFIQIFQFQEKICQEFLVKHFHEVPFNYFLNKVRNKKIVLFRKLLRHLKFNPFPSTSYASLSKESLNSLKVIQEAILLNNRLERSDVEQDFYENSKRQINELIAKGIKLITEQINSVAVTNYDKSNLKFAKKKAQPLSDFGALVASVLKKES